MAPPRPSTRAGLWAVIAGLLAASLIGTLWVPFYNRLTPKLGGFPFFYWYQLLWVPIVAILCATAYLLSRLARRDSATAETTDPDRAQATGDGPEGAT